MKRCPLPDMPSILDKIVAAKREELAEAKRAAPLETPFPVAPARLGKGRLQRHLQTGAGHSIPISSCSGSLPICCSRRSASLHGFLPWMISIPLRRLTVTGPIEDSPSPPGHNAASLTRRASILRRIPAAEKPPG